jgi:hypothetical protein
VKLDDGIRKHGFRKWYERELLQSHAHMVLAFLCFVGIFAAFELISGGHNRLLNALIVIVCSIAGTWAVRRYIRLLSSAEATANQADCPKCGTYGLLRVVDDPLSGPSHRADPDGSVVRVGCKHCAHEWSIEA